MAIIDINYRIYIIEYSLGKLIGELFVNVNTLKEIDNFFTIEKRNFIEKTFSRISFKEILSDVNNIIINDDSSIFAIKSSI